MDFDAEKVRQGIVAQAEKIVCPRCAKTISAGQALCAMGSGGDGVAVTAPPHDIFCPHCDLVVDITVWLGRVDGSKMADSSTWIEQATIDAQTPHPGPDLADRVAGHRAQIAEACEMLGLDGNAYVLDAPSLRREIEASWRELGVDMEDVLSCDDPDVRLLSQSIRVSLQHEKDEGERKLEFAVAVAISEERTRTTAWLDGLEVQLGRAIRLGGADREQLEARRGIYGGIARDLERGAHLQDTTKKGG